MALLVKEKGIKICGGQMDKRKKLVKREDEEKLRLPQERTREANI